MVRVPTARKALEGRETMKVTDKAFLLRIFISEGDRYHGRPLHEALIQKARDMHLSGATVLRGVLGFGNASRLHSSSRMSFNEDMPLVMECVESKEKIDDFLDAIDGVVGDRAVVTLEQVQVIRYQVEAPVEA